ncbi:MAG: transporter substrate-binding protein [Rhizobiaceae bacterium]|nr:transporter substrate-binding protein [Rhizobiaceae bacterium]
MTINRRTVVKGTAAAVAATLAAPGIIKGAFAADDVIKVANITDVSGGLDIYGQPQVACLELAVDEINEKGGLLGKKLEMIKYDPQSDLQLYTQFATEAATKERVSAVFGGVTSASREAIRPLLRRYNTLYFYPTLYEGGVCDRNFFCTGSTPAQTIEPLIPYVMKKFNGKKVYVIAADYNYGWISAKWVKKYVEDNGGEVVNTDYFPLDVTEFGSTIRSIQSAKPDILFTLLVGGNHISFFRQWAAAGMAGKIPMASSDFGVGNEHIVLTPKESDGIVAAYAYMQELDTEVNKAFVGRMKTKFGDNAPYVNELAATAYYSLWHWAGAVEKAGTTDRMQVIEALENNSVVDGPGGKSTIDPKTHHCILDVHIGEVENNAFKVLESIPQRPPSDTAEFCDLIANPDDNQQYVIGTKE